MTPHSSLEHDLALKRFASTPKDQKPNYPWRDTVRDRQPRLPDVQVLCPQGPEPFDLGEIAETIGKSLTTLLLARGERDIFTADHKTFVARIADEVAGNLTALALQQRPLRLDLHDLYVLIEKTLVDNNAYDVAKSLLHSRGAKLGTDRVSCSTPVRLIRRTGQVVPWNEAKIEISIRKAFLSLQQSPAPASEIARAVTARALATKEAFLHIEEVQDVVQEELMRAGHFKVAETFIIYRSMRAAVRGTETAAVPTAVVQPTMVVVMRPAGDTYLWDGHDLRLRIEFAASGLDLRLTPDEIEHELRRSVYDNISQADLAATIARNARSLIERDAEFARFAGRLQLTYLYEEALGWDIVRDGINRLREFHRRAFTEYVFEGVALGLLQPRLLEAYRLEDLAAALDPAADLALDLSAVQVLCDRFLVTARQDGAKIRHLEVPQFLWMRVAMGLCFEEKRDREVFCLGLYEVFKGRRFLPAAAVLAHAGTPNHQLLAHYTYQVEDRLEGVMQRGIADNAYLATPGGSLAGSWTAVGGAPAGSAAGASGLVPFLQLHRAMLAAVGPVAGCVYLETWHSELPAFLALHRNSAGPAKLATAHWVPDLFLQRVAAGAQWTLFRPTDTQDLVGLSGAAFARRYEAYEAQAAEGRLWHRRFSATELWREMVETILTTGESWLAFKDACAVRSPQDHAGTVRCASHGTDQVLATEADETAACSLGSVVLDAHLDAAGALDLPRLRATVRLAVRALDNVLDLHRFPTEAARRAAQRHRPLGLGAMGLAQALHVRGLAFASEEAVAFGDECCEALAHAAAMASAELAAERGPYPTFKGSKWDRGLFPADTLAQLEQERGHPVDVPRGGRLDWQPIRELVAAHGLRNCALLALSATPFIDQVAGTSPSVEPCARNLQVQSTLSGEFVVVAPALVRDLKARGLWSQEMIDNLKYFDGEVPEIASIPDDLKRKHLTAGEIDPRWLLRAAACRQKWIDQAQTLSLSLPRGGADVTALSTLLLAAWRMGLKSVWRVALAHANHPRHPAA